MTILNKIYNFFDRHRCALLNAVGEYRDSLSYFKYIEQNPNITVDGLIEWLESPDRKTR